MGEVSAPLLAGRRAVLSAPLTAAYLIVLAATTTLVTSSSPTRHAHLLLSFSTNLHELAHVPIRVLIGSAFWTDGWAEFAMWVALFVFIVAPVERRVGWRRTLAVLAAGHFGATLVVAAGLSIALHFGAVAPNVVDAEDVGASYAFFAVAAFAGYLLGAQERLVYLGVLGSYVAGNAIQSHTFTDFGHLTAVAIGLACRPLAVASARAGYGWLGGGGARHRRRGTRDVDLEPGQGLLLGAWRDQARPRAVLPRDFTTADASGRRAAGSHAALPSRRGGQLLLPEARS
jgi:hypothetical protein